MIGTFIVSAGEFLSAVVSEDEFLSAVERVLADLRPRTLAEAPYGILLYIAGGIERFLWRDIKCFRNIVLYDVLTLNPKP